MTVPEFETAEAKERFEQYVVDSFESIKYGERGYMIIPPFGQLPP
jgi:hypothetical protein